MESQLFDQFLDDQWSPDLCDPSSINPCSDSFTDYTWLNQYDPLAFNFEDLQSLSNPNSFDRMNSSSPLDFSLPSPVSDSSPFPTQEDRFNQTSSIDPWLIPTQCQNITTSPKSLPTSPLLSARSLASSPYLSPKITAPNSPNEGDSGSDSPKSKPNPTRQTRPRKPKSQPSDSSSSPGKSESPISKRQNSSHNLIEKRYRNNLNTKISALRDCIPSLASPSSVVKSEDGEDDLEAENGERGRGMKCNKGKILEKAIQYIAELERRNGRLERENKRLQGVVKGVIPDYLMVGLNTPMMCT